MGEVKYRFIEGFADGYARFGQPRLMGRIMAVLLLSPEPMSLDDITKELGMSKGPVSSEARKLEMLATVEKIVRRGSKRVYYRPVDDSFAAALSRNLALMGKSRDIAREFLDNADPDRIDPLAMKRVGEMERFYQQLITRVNGFLEDWSAGRSGEPR